MKAEPSNAPGIAIIGMAGRFPKAKCITEFWHNLCAGVDAISFFTDDELAAADVTAPAHGRYVKARGVLEEADWFDAELFEVQPKEAELMDPQHRVFLECAWQALESAGYDSSRYGGLIGVFGGMSVNTYLRVNLWTRPELCERAGEYQLALGNAADFLPTRVSYKLNLRGPSMGIQTACSTSLVAVCVACESLLHFQCDLALAGAVAISFPQQEGYLYQEGGIHSPDGHCRVFDAQAAGTVPGQGVGLVVLKRLEEALADGDSIYAVIRGFGLGNDGSRKVGYSAPSVEGQAEVIALAQGMAGFEPDTISYVEAHGTGTPLGDPVEIAGLTRAFRCGTNRENFCALGSVKSNIGHLDTAAGVAGLIKTALALHHRQLPATLYFETPNPKIEFAHSPFYVNSRLTPWPTGSTPRRAGVSSFGIGGTNAHVVLEEAPERAASGPSRSAHLLLLSAKTPVALAQAARNLARHLQSAPAINLADAAFTLQMGRRLLPQRRMVVCSSVAEAVAALERPEARDPSGPNPESGPPSVVFMFPGQGAQQVNMGRGLYEQEPTFQKHLDACCAGLVGHLGLDLRSILYPETDKVEWAQDRLTQTALTQPALFAVEYALAQLWLSWGIKPHAMIGHSIGEYVAGCLAGVFTLPAALALVAARGRFMQQMPPGAMLAIRLAEAELGPWLQPPLALSAVNGVSSCVVSGPVEAVAALEQRLMSQNVAVRRLHTSHAFHSAMMEPVLGPFTDCVRAAELGTPRIPCLSNVTGAWLTADEATNPDYWAQQLRQTVRFADGLKELYSHPGRLLLEVGPGQTLTTLARQYPVPGPRPTVLPSLPQPRSQEPDLQVMLSSLGHLWQAGGSVDWAGFYQHEQRQRLWLPGYPFQRKRYWVEPACSRRQWESGHPVPIHSSEAPSGPASPCSAPVPEGTPSVRWNTTEAAGALEAPRLVAAAPVLTELKALLAELSGLAPEALAEDRSFVQLGFDSLVLTQVSLRLEEVFGAQVPFRRLLEDLDTVAKLANHLQEIPVADAGASETKVPEPTVERAAAPSPNEGQKETVRLPLTLGQQELWFASQLSDRAACAYNESCLVSLHGKLHPGRLRRALGVLVDRHEALRITFSADGAEQVIHPHATVPLDFSALSSLPAAEREQRYRGILAAAVDRPFDLVRGPLLRAHLIRLAKAHHVLVLTCHHLVCDGHALGIVLRELAALYEGVSRDAAAPVGPPISFRRFVEREVAAEQAPERAQDDAYWLTEFQGELPVLDLPLDRPHPAARTFAGARATRRLSASLCEPLRAWSLRQGCTFFTTLLASYYAWLHRLTGQEDLVVGIPTAGRTGAGEEKLVGNCINFLPLRARLQGQIRFTDLLSGLKRQFFNALDHRHCAFGRLLQQLNLPWDPSRTPLLSTTFTMDRVTNETLFRTLDAKIQGNPNIYSYFDLNVAVLEGEQGLVLDCRYNTDVFEPATVERWLGHWETLLRGIAEDPRRSLAELPLLTQAEHEQMVTTWNQTEAPAPHDLCLHQWFERQARATPDAIAAADAQRVLTYRELNERANALAHRLRQAGAGPETLVALCVERTVGLAVGLLGILKSGSAYLPLDLQYPRQRLTFMLDDAQVPLVLTQEKLAGDLPETAAQKIWLDPFLLAEKFPAPAESVRSASTTHPENLAYVIYTSGSTGQPKGVMVTHRNVVNCLYAVQQELQIAPTDILLAITTLSFDIAGLELFLPLVAGARTFIASAEVAGDACQLAQWMDRSGATLLQATPTLWRLLVESGWAGHAPLRILCGGEALDRALADELGARGAALWNLYGPTETTIWSVAGPVVAGAGPVPIGRPLANTQAYVLDRDGHPVPVGVPGELYLGGEGVARGYLNRPELTAEKFVADPFSRRAGARLYRTGDRVRYRADGSLEFLGRADDQVKIHGHRIELGEIEALLSSLAGVRQAAVAVQREARGGDFLVAYVVAGATPPPETDSLRQALRHQLPEYMVPSAFVFLDQFPLTPNGKLNRRALPALDSARAKPDHAPVAPRNAAETKVAEIWRELLPLNGIGIHDNFFNVGGHSVLATQVVARIRREFQVDLNVRALFEAPTIAGLAQAVLHAPRATETPWAPPPQRLAPEAAQALLAKLDELSDVEVAALLTQLEAEEELTR